jgi:hypothetical protein
MTSGDETRPVPRPSLFDDNRSAEETQQVAYPYPPGQQPPRRPPVEPPDRPVRQGSPQPDSPLHGIQPPQGHDRPPGVGADDGGLFGDTTVRRDPPPGPTILANQAFDWERNLQEAEVVRSSRTGLVMLFLVALVAVVVVALGLAAWSVLGGGDDGETATDTGEEGSEDGTTPTSTGSDTSGVVPSTTVAPPIDPNALRVTVVEDPFICDGGTREFALIAGADPNEAVLFTSPQAGDLRSGQADASGELPIRWQCDPSQAGTTWELTATGEVSGRSVTFLFAGVTDPGGPGETALSVEVIEDPFVCNGETRIFAGLSGAEPNEGIAFSSPQSPNLRSGEADANGEVPLRWQCDAAQAGTVWELTATGETSGRTVTFSFTGA